MPKKTLSIKEVLTRQVAEVLPSKKGLELLMKRRKIRVYLGIDPTGLKLHLGHTIALRKLQQFAALGHEAILVVGTGTVLAGDPSQRETARKRVEEKEIKENIKTWKKQASKILDFSKVKIKYNGDWLRKLTLKDVLDIASHISAAKLFQRDMFQRRLAKGDTVWTNEFLYPLLQGYDSVFLNADLEIGGTDQTFNMLVGRALQQKMRGREKFVLMVPMILGLDGKQMSKTSGNTINILDPPKEMYGKLMTLRDDLIKSYLELCTSIPKPIIKKKSNRELKGLLAKTIVDMYHGNKAALAAAREFNRVFRQKKLPSRIPTVRIPAKSIALSELLVKTRLASSKSEARRLIAQRGVKIDGQVQEDAAALIAVKKGTVVQVGKRHFAKLA